MIEAHSLGEDEVNPVILDFLIWDGEFVQLRWAILHLEQILRRCFLTVRFVFDFDAVLNILFFILLFNLFLIPLSINQAISLFLRIIFNKIY